MSNLKLGKAQFGLTSITQSSLSPSDVSTTEDGTITYTYTNDAQRYEFQLKGMTTSHAQYAQVAARMEQLSNSDTFLLDLYSWGDGIFPFFGTITNSVYVNGAHSAGTSEISYEATTANPSGVVPNGLLGIGDLIKFDGATYDKLYRVVGFNGTTHKYTISPSLREAITDDTKILYGDDVEARVRVVSDTFTFTGSGKSPLIREYTIVVTEDYTSTT